MWSEPTPTQLFEHLVISQSSRTSQFNHSSYANEKGRADHRHALVNKEDYEKPDVRNKRSANSLQPQNALSYSNLGFGSPGIQVTMPLSSEFALSIWHPKVVRDSLNGRNDALKSIQQIKATRILNPRANSQSLDNQEAQLESILDRLNPLLDNLDNGQAIHATSENMDHYNSLQYYWSLRFVTSKHDDFSLAKKMFQDDPQQGARFLLD